MLGVRLPSGDWVYPAVQFGPDGAPLPGLAVVLGAFRGIASPWMRLEHLLAPDPALSPKGMAATTPGQTAREFVADDAPRSALHTLRDEGPNGIPAIVAALQQVGDADA